MRCAWKLVCGAVAACSAVASADVVIDFDEQPNQAVMTDQYRGLGVVFSGNWVVQGPGPGTNAASGVNSVLYYDPASQQNNYTVAARFVAPGTDLPATTQSVSFTPTDASSGGTLFTIRAYNAAGFEIAFAQRFVDAAGVFDPQVDTPVTVLAPAGQAIAMVEFSVALETAGNRVIEGDNFRFGTLTVPPCGPADVGSVGGVPGADHILDNNDFIVFVDLFFAQSPSADRGSTGAVPVADGAWDNNDFIVFIDQFFAGC
ncbi:MAG TPA: GC-type dockerin domain-anchored protein [Phycisphaerales bacterium]|nr:GC-type dockerin domain-anchored protein [Phycisphaerales bacterium]